MSIRLNLFEDYSPGGLNDAYCNVWSHVDKANRQNGLPYGSTTKIITELNAYLRRYHVAHINGSFDKIEFLGKSAAANLTFFMLKWG